MRTKRTRLALAGMLTLAVTLFAGLTFGGAATAAKKKGGGGGGGTKTINKGGAAIPDDTFAGVDLDNPPDGFPDNAGNGGQFKSGVLVSKITVGEKLAAAKIKDLNVQVDITHTDIGDISVQLYGPNGQYVGLNYGNENYPDATANALPPGNSSLGKFGPTTFDDQAPVYINDTNSCPNLTTETEPGACDAPRPDGAGVEAFAPYAGSFKPEDGTLAGLGSKLMGNWFLVIFDNDPFAGSSDTIDIGRLNNWKLIAQLKGGGGGKKGKK